jgi:hypothetical protein
MLDPSVVKLWKRFAQKVELGERMMQVSGLSVWRIPWPVRGYYMLCW